MLSGFRIKFFGVATFKAESNQDYETTKIYNKHRKYRHNLVSRSTLRYYSISYKVPEVELVSGWCGSDVQEGHVVLAGPVRPIVHLDGQNVFVIFAVRLHVVYYRGERSLAQRTLRLHL